MMEGRREGGRERGREGGKATVADGCWGREPEEGGREGGKRGKSVTYHRLQIQLVNVHRAFLGRVLSSTEDIHAISYYYSLVLVAGVGRPALRLETGPHLEEKEGREGGVMSRCTG